MMVRCVFRVLSEDIASRAGKLQGCPKDLFPSHPCQFIILLFTRSTQYNNRSVGWTSIPVTDKKVFSPSPWRPNRSLGPPCLPCSRYLTQSGQIVTLSTHFHLMSKLRIRLTYTSTPTYVFVACCLMKHGDSLPLALVKAV